MVILQHEWKNAIAQVIDRIPGGWRQVLPLVVNDGSTDNTVELSTRPEPLSLVTPVWVLVSPLRPVNERADGHGIIVAWIPVVSFARGHPHAGPPDR